MAQVSYYGVIVNPDMFFGLFGPLDGQQVVEISDSHIQVDMYGVIIHPLSESTYVAPVTPPEPPPISYTIPIVRLNPIPDSVGDISLIPDEVGDGDIVFLPGDVSCDAGLQTAVYMSLFTDAPVEVDGYEVRGWWGDTLDEYGIMGSKLWTLTREKMVKGISTLARDYCLEALAWVISENVGSALECNVTRSGVNSLSIEVMITKPNNTDEYYRYEFNWSAQQYAGI